MELQYLILVDCLPFKDKREVKFTGEYHFSLSEFDHVKRALTLKIDKNDHYLVDYFVGNILNISAITGENGTGKTTFLEFLTRFLNNRQYLGEKWLAVFKEGDSIKIFHSLYDVDHDEGNPDRFYYNSWDVNCLLNGDKLQNEEITPWGLDKTNIHLKQNGGLLNTKTIFYSGIFDLKGYPYQTSKTFFDISTNHLIGIDAEEHEYTLPRKDVLLKHKHKNILRQIKLAELHSELLEADFVKVPKSISLIFERVEIDPSGSRDLSSKSKEAFEYFRGRIGKTEYPNVNSKLHASKKDKVQYNIFLREKLKLRFYDAIIYNFFGNFDNSDKFGVELTVDLSGFDKMNIFDAVLSFFDQQKWTDREAFNPSSLIETTCNIIDNEENKPIDDIESNVLEIYYKINAVEFIDLYERYLGSFPGNDVVGFASFSWRDLSSGQKSMLDLYSRLLYAKQEIRKQYLKEVKDNKNIEFKPLSTLYVLFDEAELGFHPEWQRRFINDIERFISFLFLDKEGGYFFNTKMQIIIASHSPFTISDLPKSNVVFLRRNEERLFVSEEHEIEQTLGSNIHTLLSSSFYMEGRIGKKVETELYEIIELLTSEEEKGNSEILRIQNFIINFGEPIIKQRLESLFNRKFQFEYNDDLDKVASLMQHKLAEIDKIRKRRDSNKGSI